MSSLDGQFYQFRSWEAIFPMQSPEGKLRVLIVEAGKIGMKFRVVDRWREDNLDISEEMFTDHFWTNISGLTPNEFESFPCALEDAAMIEALLGSLDGAASGVSIERIEQLFNLCVIRPQVRKHGGWLKEYLPDLYKHHEAVFLRSRESIVKSVLQE